MFLALALSIITLTGCGTSHGYDSQGLRAPRDAGSNGAMSDAGPPNCEITGSGTECPRGCEARVTMCNGHCVDFTNDVASCGACNHACGDGDTCVQARCVTPCRDEVTFGPGFLQCGAVCVDTYRDAARCGSCDHACGADEVCRSGVCAPPIGACGIVPCPDAGAAPDDPDAATPDAGQDAGPNAICIGFGQCGSSCYDLQTDNQHCGACDNVCEQGYACTDSVCKLVCDRPGDTNCYGSCVDLLSSSYYCGACGVTCDNQHSCVNGSCTCNAGTSVCGDTCSDLQSDPDHCGSCDTACQRHASCALGSCVCPTDYAQCSSGCADLTTDAQHCGSCDALCASGEYCHAGVCETPANAWPTFQHDVQHSGENAQETGKPPLALAWSRQLSTTSPVNPVAIADGRVFATLQTSFAASSPLYALSLADGSDLWSYDFGAIATLGHPAVFDGAVYLGNGQAGQDTTTQPSYAWSFDAATGQANWHSDLVPIWEVFWAPIRVGNRLYMNGGDYESLTAFDTSDGTQRFVTPLGYARDGWAAAYADGYLFTYLGGQLSKEELSTGRVRSSLSLRNPAFGDAVQTAPVLVDDRAYVITYQKLYAIDVETNSVAWSANDYDATPAVSHSVIYGVSKGTLVARSALSGVLLWSFAGDSGLVFPPVIANGHVYVASLANTYAVDVATHAQVWTDALGGWLAIADHHLLVAGVGGTLNAYALTP